MEESNKYKKIIETRRLCVIIPTFNNGTTIKSVIEGVLNYTSEIIVVNDGSTDDTENILSEFDKIEIVNFENNCGKGMALRKGFEYARNLDYNYAITIDSDGQHMPEDIPNFLNKLEEEPYGIIVGDRNMNQDGIPRSSNFGNKFSNFWFSLETGVKIPDTQSGYRLYPLRHLSNIKFYTKKFEFEIEVLVRAAWRNIKISSVPVKVFYAPADKRISHFRPFKDFARISVLNTILVLITLLYIKPYKTLKYFRKKRLKEVIREQFLRTDESNLKKTFSVMLGSFLAIAPIWGWQLAAAIALAYILKLNKVIVFVTVNFSIPPMIPLIIFASIKTGAIVLNYDSSLIDFDMSFSLESIKRDLYQYVVGSLVFGVVFSLFMGILTFSLLNIFRKKNINTIVNKN